MVMEIHEDQPLVEAGAPWIRQFWAPAISMRTYTNFMFHPARIATNEEAQMTYRMPTDFVVMDNLFLILWGAWTAAGSFDVRISFGQPGEAYNVHTLLVNVGAVMVLDQLTSVDLVPPFAALLANLVANDVVLVNVKNVSVNRHNVVGIDGRYS